MIIAKTVTACIKDMNYDIEVLETYTNGIIENICILYKIEIHFYNFWYQAPGFSAKKVHIDR